MQCQHPGLQLRRAPRPPSTLTSPRRLRRAGSSTQDPLPVQHGVPRRDPAPRRHGSLLLYHRLRLELTVPATSASPISAPAQKPITPPTSARSSPLHRNQLPRRRNPQSVSPNCPPNQLPPAKDYPEFVIRRSEAQWRSPLLYSLPPRRLPLPSTNFASKNRSASERLTAPAPPLSYGAANYQSPITPAPRLPSPMCHTSPAEHPLATLKTTGSLTTNFLPPPSPSTPPRSPPATSPTPARHHQITESKFPSAPSGPVRYLPDTRKQPRPSRIGTRNLLHPHHRKTHLIEHALSIATTLAPAPAKPQSPRTDRHQTPTSHATPAAPAIALHAPRTPPPLSPQSPSPHQPSNKISVAFIPTPFPHSR